MNKIQTAQRLCDETGRRLEYQNNPQVRLIRQRRTIELIDCLDLESNRINTYGLAIRLLEEWKLAIEEYRAMEYVA